MFIRKRSKEQRKRSELLGLGGKRPNYNIYKEKVSITMFVRKRSDLQCLKGYGPNDNVCHQKV